MNILWAYEKNMFYRWGEGSLEFIVNLVLRVNMNSLNWVACGEEKTRRLEVLSRFYSRIVLKVTVETGRNKNQPTFIKFPPHHSPFLCNHIFFSPYSIIFK